VDTKELIKRYSDGERNFRNKLLVNADLQNMDLQNVDLYLSDLFKANLSFANLYDANLQKTNLKESNLQNTNLIGANLQCADLRGANLENTKGLLNTKEWMDKTFKKTDKGYIVYKAFNCMYTLPSHWRIKKGSTIEEKVDMDRCDACSYGINFATKDWIKRECPSKKIWKCLLRFEDMENLCVPYATDGKARCGKLTLLKSPESATTTWIKWFLLLSLLLMSLIFVFMQTAGN
jgi:uncharacterized protein YjbI with pentapeptide repeats